MPWQAADATGIRAFGATLALIPTALGRPRSGVRQTGNDRHPRSGVDRVTRSFFFAALLLAFAVAPQGQELFQAATDVAGSVEPVEPYVVRSRAATLDRDQLLDSMADGSPFVLNLFPDARFEARIVQSRTASGANAFVYAVVKDGGHATLFVAGDIVRGEVHSPRGVYAIRSGGGGKGGVRIEQLDASRLPVVDHWPMVGSDADISAWTSRIVPVSVSDEEEEAQGAGPDETVDLLVVYTPAAEAHEGGRAETEATIISDVEKTNQAFANSGLIHRRIRLVAMERVDYAQSADAAEFSYAVRVLRHRKGADHDAEGILDEVLERRETYGADLVPLFVGQHASRQAGCGFGTDANLYLRRSVERGCADESNPEACVARTRRQVWRRRGYSVTQIVPGCTAGHTFVHELGHNFGLWHDRYAENEFTPLRLTPGDENFPHTTYGFGYVNQNFSRSTCHRTIMAYRAGCIDEPGAHHRPTGSFLFHDLMFSNPDLELGSEEVGFDPAGVHGDEWTVALDGPVNAARAIDDVWDIVANLWSLSETGHAVPFMPSASDPGRQGFIRVVNHSNEAGEVAIEAFDDAGTGYPVMTLSLDANETAHFNSDDLGSGNALNGLSGGIGTGEGDWRLKLTSLLEIEVLAYVRTSDGFLTSMHDLIPASGPGRRAPFFNPGSNENQVSMLRLVNDYEEEVEVLVTGIDDDGVEGGEVRVVIPPHAARTFTAQELEQGSERFKGAFGDGAGKWRLFVENVDTLPVPDSDAQVRVVAMSLLESPTGHLTNLSTVPRNEYQGTHSVPLFPSKTAEARQGFARIVNRTEEAAEVSILAYDDDGDVFGPVTLSLDAGETAHFNSHDLEDGNESKGLAEGSLIPSPAAMATAVTDAVNVRPNHLPMDSEYVLDLIIGSAGAKA